MVLSDSLKKNERTALNLPLWFLILAIAAIGVRAYWKVTQFTVSDGTGIYWLTPEEFKDQKDVLTNNGKRLVLYEFTAKWCPPCQKRERTDFKNPDIVKKINSNFIPVLIDLTHAEDSDKPLNRELIESFSVYSIPRCVITLNSGEKVEDDRYSFDKEFDEFLNDTIEQSKIVKAEILLADGREKEAFDCIKDCMQDIDKNLNYISAPKFILYHHLLCRLGHEKDAISLVERAAANSASKKQFGGKASVDTLVNGLTGYMLGKIDEKKLLNIKTNYYEKCSFHLAIGLCALRKGDKVTARKGLQDAAIENARMWRGDKLAEYILKKWDD